MTPIDRAAHTMRVAADSLPLRSDDCASPLAERLYAEADKLKNDTVSLTDDLAFYVARFGTRAQIEAADAVFMGEDVTPESVVEKLIAGPS